MMYVPAWQGLTLRHFTVAPIKESAPFPLRHRRSRGFHTARSAIYQLFKALVASGRRRVLAPDYHMGNELRAIRATGAEVELYPIDRDGQPDLATLSKQAARGADVLFIIHYAGWPQPVYELRALCDRHGLQLVGHIESLCERYYAISVERKLRHPAVVAISNSAREQLFRPK